MPGRSPSTLDFLTPAPLPGPTTTRPHRLRRPTPAAVRSRWFSGQPSHLAHRVARTRVTWLHSNISRRTAPPGTRCSAVSSSYQRRKPGYSRQNIIGDPNVKVIGALFPVDHGIARKRSADSATNGDGKGPDQRTCAGRIRFIAQIRAEGLVSDQADTSAHAHS
jgi:hypothetical protein